ncbi:type VI secretion system tube protein Hcp, partial [Escherichia coli]|uniref:type VI secretion system tube protein Hcp n=1 Tax=Escherichia coli TaxID=562 RepID=UPI0021196A1B
LCGLVSGQRAHKPFIFTVALNKAVPLLYNALASGEMLPKVELHWWRTSVEGKQGRWCAGRGGGGGGVGWGLRLPPG